MTITEKILAAHAGRDEVRPGESIWCDIDVLMTHDICGPGTIGVFREHFGEDAKVWDAEKIVIIPDHYIFTADAKSHRNIDLLREFVKQQGIRHYYDPDFIPPGLVGMPTPYTDPTKTSYAGVCHGALPEHGHIRPGEILLGTDSHTCTAGAFGMFATGIGNTDAGFVMGTGKLWLKVPESMRFTFRGTLPAYCTAKDIILHSIGEIGTDGATYRAMEFDGEAVMQLGVDERCTICNMAIEAGGKNGIIAADKVTEQYVKERTDKPFTEYASDPDATYYKTFEFDAAALEPTVALPHSPDNRALARELDVTLDRAYIGSCTGGRTNDFIAAAHVLSGRKVAIDTFIVPATTQVDADLDRLKVGGKTLREVFRDAGCRIGPASCAACLGGPEDTFGRANEPIKVVTSTNRNFPGRMGHKEAGVHLASPLTTAASAVTGKVTDPRDIMEFDRPFGRVE